MDLSFTKEEEDFRREFRSWLDANLPQEMRSPDFWEGKTDDEAVIGALVANPWVMRQLPRLLRTAGLELVATFSHVLAEIGRADFWSSAIEAYRRLVASTGAMPRQQADAWADRLRSDSDDGVFFGTCNYFAYIARRP